MDYLIPFALLLIGCTLAVLVLFAPGLIARCRNHPRQRAIGLLGLLGGLLFPPLWIVAVVWAFID